MAGMTETWEKEIREFEMQGGDVFDEKDRKTGILGTIAESGDLKGWLDMYEDELNSYDDWRREIMRWAKKKRVDSSKQYAGPIGAVGNADHPPHIPGVAGQGQGQG